MLPPRSTTSGGQQEPDSVFLRVYTGESRRLCPTEELIAIPRVVLPDAYERCALQKSAYDRVFWFLVDQHRFQNKCWCSKCKTMFSGAGRNLYSHIAVHSRRREFTPKERLNALFLFLLRHGIGLTATRDPLLRMALPDATYLSILNLLDATTVRVRQEITRIFSQREYFIMIDGWSDQSLRRYVGIVAGSFSIEENRLIFHCLELWSQDALDHSARSQRVAISHVLQRYQLATRHCYCLASDSASVNAAIANEMRVDWCPCAVHLWNLIVRNFFTNSPDSLGDLLTRINNLRKKSRWIEFLGTRGQCRNIEGYSPTRWCSACHSLESFYDLNEFVFEYQKEDSQTTFTKDDIGMIEEIRLILRRFVEVNSALEAADANQGLATVFETVNTIGLVLTSKCEREGPFRKAYQKAVEEINQRFFNLSSKFCCRVIFAGVLNVAHSIPPWLEGRMENVAQIMLSELELFTGGTPPNSPRDSQGERYVDHRSIQEILNDSGPPSESADPVCDEIREFLTTRKQLARLPFTTFWKSCSRFRHLQMMALKLRAYPTNTVILEQSFSRARRILSWSRMRMTQETANKLWLLTCNERITSEVLGLATDLSSKLDVVDEEQNFGADDLDEREFFRNDEDTEV